MRPFFRDHSPGSIARSCWSMHSRRSMPGRMRCSTSKTRWPRSSIVFRVGQNLFSAMIRPRIDRIVLAATKADHMHHDSHDRLEAMLTRLAERPRGKPSAGAQVDVVALAAVRATREATVRRGRQELPSISACPKPARCWRRNFDGLTEAAMFPGDCPSTPTTCSAATPARFAALPPPRRKTPISFPALAAAGPGDDRAAAYPPCLTFASTARCNS